MKAKKATTLKPAKIVLIASIALNVIFIVGIIWLLAIFNSAGTNRYSASILNHAESFIYDQYCTGKGYQHLQSLIVNNSTSNGYNAAAALAEANRQTKLICNY